MNRASTLLLFAIILTSCQTKPVGWRQLNLSKNPTTSAGGAISYNTYYDYALYLPGNLGETWLWKEGNWVQLHPANQPPPRSKFTMAYHEAVNKIVVFGGGYGETLYDDTWEWDGSNWIHRETSHTPPARCCSAMAYDNSLGKILLYGGWDPRSNTFLNDLWVWDGIDWTEMQCCSMPLMSGHKMVTYSSKILSTFTSGLGTQIWNGKTWDNLEISSPPDRPDSALAYDSAHDLVVLFGGKRNGVILNDTWVFDGKNWGELRFSTVPPARDAHVMFYDEERGSIILFGGISESGVLGDTWELNLSEDVTGFVVTQIPPMAPTLEECSWSGMALAWNDSNANGIRETTESPLSDIRFFTDGYLQESEIVDWGVTGTGGSIGLILLLTGCPDLQFDVYPEIPQKCRLTTPPRLQVDTRKVGQEFSFGFLCN